MHGKYQNLIGNLVRGIERKGIRRNLHQQLMYQRMMVEDSTDCSLTISKPRLPACLHH